MNFSLKNRLQTMNFSVNLKYEIKYSGHKWTAGPETGDKI